MKSTKYLKYAIGEIVLVVIGILIALSLNNWNDSKKTARKETALLKRVKKENLYNIGFLEENMAFLENQDTRVYELYSALSQPRSKKTDQEVESLISNVISMGMYTFPTQYLERYINSSENDGNELTIDLIGLKDNLTAYVKATDFTYSYQMDNTWPFIEKGFDMVNFEIIDHDILRDRVFINRLVVLEDMSSSNYENLMHTISEAKQIDSLITRRLAQ